MKYLLAFALLTTLVRSCIKETEEPMASVEVIVDGTITDMIYGKIGLQNGEYLSFSYAFSKNSKPNSLYTS